MKNPLRILAAFFLLAAVAAAVRGLHRPAGYSALAPAEPSVLRLKFVSRDGADGSYKLMVENVVRRIPSVDTVDEDHRIPGTRYKVEIYAPGFAGPELILEKLSKLQLVHEDTGNRIILMLGLTAAIEGPDGQAPRVRPDEVSK